MKERRRVPYGPFVGYRSSVKKENAQQNEATADSHDWRFNAQEGKWIERDGSVKIGDGITESSNRFRARRIIEFPSIKRNDNYPQFEDGYPSYMALYTTEIPGVLASSSFDRGFGQLVFRTTNATDAFLTPAASFNTTVYPTTTRNIPSFFKCIPLWFSEDSPHRCVSATRRTEMAAGSRNVLISGGWAYLSNLFATPMRWNLQYNRSTETGYPNRKERHLPTGMFPPLFPARIKNTDLTTTAPTTNPWKEFDRCFLSMCWIREDGQWGPPFVPTLRTDAAVSGYSINRFGLVTLPHLSGAGVVDYYASVPLRGIPRAPADCPYKAILRSPKVDGSTAAMPKTNDLRIVDIIPGDQTSYDMRDGDDAALKIDDDLVRYDQILPPRARHMGEFDGRVGIGFTWRHPGVLICAPTAAGATLGVEGFDSVSNEITRGDDLNRDNTGVETPNLDSLVDGRAALNWMFGIRITSTDLLLYRQKVPPGGALGTFTIALANLTVRQLIDAVNATVPTDTAGEWRAAPCPGVDMEALVANALAGGSGADDYGDDTCFNSASNGFQAAHSQAYPAIVYWARSTMRTKYPNPDRSAFWHTTNTPLSSAAGVSSAPNYFLRRNRHTPPIDSGDYMGLVALTDGTVLFYSQKVWLYRNTFAGRTGKDEDYRFDLLSEDGSIAWGGQFSFPGGAGWLSKKGILVTDGTPGHVSLISKALYDPDTGLGDLAAEIAECIKAMAFGLDDPASGGPAARFFAEVIGHELLIRYRSAARIAEASGFAATDVRKNSCDIRQRYDFSGGIPGDGLSSMLGPGGAPHGWGTRELKEGTVMGYFHGAAGLVKLEAVETENPNADAKDGRIDQFDTGYRDSGVSFTTRLVTMMDNMGEERRRHRVRKVTVRYKSPSGHSLKMQFARDRDRASVGADYSLDTTGAAEVGSQTKRTRLAHQAPARVSEVAFTATRVETAAEIHGVEKLVEVLETPV